MEILSKSEIELLQKEAREEMARLMKAMAQLEAEAAAEKAAAKGRKDRPAAAEKSQT